MISEEDQASTALAAIVALAHQLNSSRAAFCRGEEAGLNILDQRVAVRGIGSSAIGGPRGRSSAAQLRCRKIALVEIH
jgi:hypothetical protein